MNHGLKLVFHTVDCTKSLGQAYSYPSVKNKTTSKPIHQNKKSSENLVASCKLKVFLIDPAELIFIWRSRAMWSGRVFKTIFYLSGHNSFSMLRVISSDGLQKRHCLKDRVTPIELMRQYTYARARVRGAAPHRPVPRLATLHIRFTVAH